MTTTTEISTEVIFTRHAIARYRERVRPTLSVDQVVVELNRIAAHARLLPEAPHWLAHRQRQASPLYLMAADAVFPLKQTAPGAPWQAVTCIARGSISSHTRVRRNAARSARQVRRRKRQP